MELTHRFSVPASLDQAWASFNDLESIAPCFPGATITGIEGDDFTGTVKIKLGPISLLYNGTGTFAIRDEDAHHAVIEAKGKDKRGNGTASATVSATFAAEGDETTVEVNTDLTVTGKPAQFGRGVISDISDKLLNQFVECISGRFAGGDLSGAAGGGEADPVPGPDQGRSGSGLDAFGHGGPADSDPVGTGDGPAGGGAQSGGASGASAAASGAASPPSHSEPDHAAPSQPRPAPTWTPPKREPAELNMLSTAVPVLARRYGPAGIGALVAGLIIVRLIRRQR